jgi:hypothetical protein
MQFLIGCMKDLGYGTCIACEACTVQHGVVGLYSVLHSENVPNLASACVTMYNRLHFACKCLFQTSLIGCMVL